MATRNLEEIDPSLLSWIQRNAKFNRSWDELLLRGLLDGRGVPCSDVLVAWERDLHALGERNRMASPYLLELSDTGFGTVAAGAAQATLPGDGRNVVIIGRFVWGGALGMDERGRLYSSDGDEWIALAEHPAVYLARLALAGMAEEEQRLHLVLPGREQAGLLAERLGVVEILHGQRGRAYAPSSAIDRQTPARW
ncbi:hypothetical protein BE20_13670 [Sorangium cellulosum]|nr:hypothetical protein BE20_13670 [Sorangium cellulosum]